MKLAAIDALARLTSRITRPTVTTTHSKPTVTTTPSKPAVTTTPSKTSTTPTYSALRHVYCLGDPTYGTAGFSGNYTSTGWGRQYPSNHPERVSFDDSVAVMQSVGCHTIRAELQAGDLDTKGGTSNLRAQIYKDGTQALYDTLLTNPGQTSWYGMAFSTNPGFVPQGDIYPSWNGIFTWHGTGSGGGAPIAVEISTKAISNTVCYNNNTYLAWPDGQPHLMLEVDGGDPTKWPTGGATCLRYAGPDFIAGHLYRMQMRITWSDNFQGSVQWYVDGVKYADVTGISDMQLGGNVYPMFQNYRPFATSFSTNDLYYGGLVVGSTLADVEIPH
jgi:hypothetical protein